MEIKRKIDRIDVIEKIIDNQVEHAQKSLNYSNNEEAYKKM